MMSYNDEENNYKNVTIIMTMMIDDPTPQEKSVNDHELWQWW